MLKFFAELYTILALLTSIMDIGAGAQASPGKNNVSYKNLAHFAAWAV